MDDDLGATRDRLEGDFDLGVSAVEREVCRAPRQNDSLAGVEQHVRGIDVAPGCSQTSSDPMVDGGFLPGEGRVHPLIHPRGVNAIRTG